MQPVLLETTRNSLGRSHVSITAGSAGPVQLPIPRLVAVGCGKLLFPQRSESQCVWEGQRILYGFSLSSHQHRFSKPEHCSQVSSACLSGLGHSKTPSVAHSPPALVTPAILHICLFLGCFLRTAHMGFYS